MKASLAISATILAFAAFAAPDLQPCVKEYRALGGKVFSIRGLQVFYQDQRQCEIAADGGNVAPAAVRDWPDSPLWGAGATGGNIGLYQ